MGEHRAGIHQRAPCFSLFADRYMRSPADEDLPVPHFRTPSNAISLPGFLMAVPLEQFSLKYIVLLQLNQLNRPIHFLATKV